MANPKIWWARCSVCVTSRDGVEQTLQGAANMSVMEAIGDAGIDGVLVLCGGGCSCATCHVYVDSAFADVLPAMTEDENDLLDSSDRRRENARLSCHILFGPDLESLRRLSRLRMEQRDSGASANCLAPPPFRPARSALRLRFRPPCTLHPCR